MMVSDSPPDLADEAAHLQMLQSKQSIMNNVLWQRKDQLDRWKSSEMNKEASKRRPERNPKVKFCESDIFLSACISGDEDEVEELIKQGTDINTFNIDGVTALHQAVIDDKFEVVKFLVEHGADINVQDNEGWTPLHAAVCCANIDIIRYLCSMGADLTVVNSDWELAIDLVKDDDCKRFLENEYAHKEITYDECRDREINSMRKDCADWIARGQFGDRPHQRTGATALHVAAAKNYIQLIVPLLKAGADVNSRDFDGWTPLHAAAHWGHVEACKLLLENGSSFDETNFAGDTVIRVADDSILDELKEIEYDLKEGTKKEGQILQNNNSLANGRKTSRPNDKLQILSIRQDLEQNENTALASTSHEYSPPPAKKAETDGNRILLNQPSNSHNSHLNSQFTTSAHVELVKQNGDVCIESDPIRLPPSSTTHLDDEDVFSKDTSVSSTGSKSSADTFGDQSDRNLMSTSEDISKSCSEISQVSSSSDFTTRLPLLDSSSETAVHRPLKLPEPVKRIHQSEKFQRHLLDSTPVPYLVTHQQAGSKESSASPHVEFTVRMKGNRGRMVAGCFSPVVSNVQRCASSPPSVPWVSLLRSNGYNGSAVKPLYPLNPLQDEPAVSDEDGSHSLCSQIHTRASCGQNLLLNGKINQPGRLIHTVPLHSFKLSSWQTPPMQPSQKDEREAERKAKSRMQRATRRSTQAITSEDLNSARSWKRLHFIQEGSVDSDQESTKKENDDSLTESSSNSSVNLDPANNITVRNSMLAAGDMPSPAHHTLCISSPPSISCHSRSPAVALAPVALEDVLAANCTIDDVNGEGVAASNLLNDNFSQKVSKNDVNYKELYEKQLMSKDNLLKQIELLEKKLQDSEGKIASLQLVRSTSISTSLLVEKDKRAYERKIEELEHKTKDYDQIRVDNKRLKEENGALIRVISKLSK